MPAPAGDDEAVEFPPLGPACGECEYSPSSFDMPLRKGGYGLVVRRLRYAAACEGPTREEDRRQLWKSCVRSLGRAVALRVRRMARRALCGAYMGQRGLVEVRARELRAATKGRVHVSISLADLIASWRCIRTSRIAF